MVEVAHGLASLVCSVHPFAALHAGSCKRRRAREVRSRVWEPVPRGMLLMEAAVTIQPAGRRPSAKSKLQSMAQSPRSAPQRPRGWDSPSGTSSCWRSLVTLWLAEPHCFGVPQAPESLERAGQSWAGNQGRQESAGK